jgi:phosphoglucomutase
MTIASAIESAVQSGQLLASSRENILRVYQSPGLEAWAKLSIEELVAAAEWTELNDRFYANLKFGTGGIRGRTISKKVTAAEKGTLSPLGAPEHAGVGTNVMNDANIRYAALGLGEYLLKNFPKQKSKVVIAHDTRHFSRHFAELVADCLRSQGHESYLFMDSRSTPQLSFTVRWLKAQAGIVISASHNPFHDNGFKCYFDDGAQVVEPHASGIISEVNRLKDGAMPTIATDSESDSVRHVTRFLGEEADEAYIKALETLVLEPETIQKAKSQLKIVYSSLHGTGIQIIPRLLQKFGFNLHIVPEQEKGDGRFPTVQSPNPENAEALAISIAQAKEENADIVIATDPDCDRMGVAIRNAAGEFEIVSGNIIGTLMGYYRIRRFFAQGVLNDQNKSHGVLIKTFVTTDLQKTMAEKNGLKCVETLTGFKYIGEKLRNYEEEAGLQGQDALPAIQRRAVLLEKSSFFVFGGEESYGYSGGDYVRDKDGNAAALMFAEAAAEAKVNGKTLLDVLDEIYRQYGFYTEKLGTLTFEGAAGAAQIKKLLESYRSTPPQVYQGKRVVRIQDFERETFKDVDGKVIPKEMMLIFHLEDGCRMAVRGSGTEPKIKFYFFAKADAQGDLSAVKSACKSSLESWWKEVQEDVKKRVE